MTVSTHETWGGVGWGGVAVSRLGFDPDHCHFHKSRFISLHLKLKSLCFMIELTVPASLCVVTLTFILRKKNFVKLSQNSLFHCSPWPSYNCKTAKQSLLRKMSLFGISVNVTALMRNIID